MVAKKRESKGKKRKQCGGLKKVVKKKIFVGGGVVKKPASKQKLVGGGLVKNSIGQKKKRKPVVEKLRVIPTPK